MDYSLMIIFSILAGCLSTMNVWVYKLDDMRIHLNDVYMILLMTSWMIFFMSAYHKDIKYATISMFFIVMFIYFIRNQTFINKSQFMKGMIPHHSMALTMAHNIKENTNDEKVIGLANNIITSQKKEIEFMKGLGY